jgi:hypothetical protein
VATASATLQSVRKDTYTKRTDVSVPVTITHNSARLYYHTDGNVYEYVGNDASGNRIYRNQDR